MRYLLAILICEIAALAGAFGAFGTAADKLAGSIASGLTGFAVLGHMGAAFLCGCICIADSVRTIRNAR